MAKQFQSVQSVQKARTIASFVKKNNHLFKQSSNFLAYFLCSELSKCNSNEYTYRIDDVEIYFYLDTQNSDARQGGYLRCNVINLYNWDVNSIFSSNASNVRYYYKNNGYDNFSLFDKIFDNVLGKEVERKVLFEWDKIIECMG